MTEETVELLTEDASCSRLQTVEENGCKRGGTEGGTTATTQGGRTEEEGDGRLLLDGRRDDVWRRKADRGGRQGR
ncbi:retinal-specific ATP-binding cassette transporter [Sesbania bispinosa]|nr:retinal-specific ATP-binding cassette transporter [Sesbania bispinosa]